MVDLNHAIWWHVYPLGATGAPIRAADNTSPWAGHRLGQLEAWLDYVVELGCNGLLLGPIFESTSHGYDTLDYYRLDPRLGDESDWQHFVDAAHSRGILIMLDGVFNHVGINHPLVEAARAGNGMIDMDGGNPRSWEGHGDLAELDHSDPRVADMVVDVMTHWLDRGADGWRLDVAYAVPGWFWSQVLARVRTTHPDARFLGEVIHGDYAAIAADGTLDSVTAYELWKGIWSSIHDCNMWELAHAVERHADFSRTTLMQTFIGNHDVDRIASQVGEDGAALAAAILFALPGMPSIYYGDEQAFLGAKGTGWSADDDVRPALPATPAELPDGGWWMYDLYRELIAVRRRHPWIVNGQVEVLDKTNTSIAFAVRAGDNELLLTAECDRPSAEIAVNGHLEFSWRSEV